MGDPVRLILWATPRTCSSVLLKSLSSLPDSQMIFEVYTTAYFWGPDRLDPIHAEEPVSAETKLDGEGLLRGNGSGFATSICSFDWARRQLEADYPGKKVIIAKEIAPWLNARYGDLPGGYRHAFLIRDPYKMFPSWKKLNQEMLQKKRGIKVSLEELELDQLPPEIVPPGLTYKEIFDLWQHVRDSNLDPDPIIIDSDELISNPAQVLSAFCKKVGMPYSESLLSWEEGITCVDDWIVSSWSKHCIENMGIFHNFRNSTCFIKPKAESTAPDLKSFSPDIQRCIQRSMPYYSKMYEQCLKF